MAPNRSYLSLNLFFKTKTNLGVRSKRVQFVVVLNQFTFSRRHTNIVALSVSIGLLDVHQYDSNIELPNSSNHTGFERRGEDVIWAGRTGWRLLG